VPVAPEKVNCTVLLLVGVAGEVRMVAAGEGTLTVVCGHGSQTHPIC